jgi:hypothetical protein
LDDNPLVSPSGCQAGEDGARNPLRPRRFQRPVQRARHDSRGVLQISGPRSCRDSALRYECHEEVLDPSDSFSGYAEAVRHLTAAGFELKGDKAHEAVGRQLAQNSNSSLDR